MWLERWLGKRMSQFPGCLFFIYADLLISFLNELSRGLNSSLQNTIKKRKFFDHLSPSQKIKAPRIFCRGLKCGAASASPPFFSLCCTLRILTHFAEYLSMFARVKTERLINIFSRSSNFLWLCPRPFTLCEPHTVYKHMTLQHILTHMQFIY